MMSNIIPAITHIIRRALDLILLHNATAMCAAQLSYILLTSCSLHHNIICLAKVLLHLHLDLEAGCKGHIVKTPKITR